MSARARILALRIMDLVKKNPEAATTLGISAILASCKDCSTNIDKTAKPIVVTRIM
ncbi:MAG: hypothetical protein IKK00_05900 [Oscillospiraceae bacterium]|nr:hypothetical protein [Oscillospiraceae bacterium]